MPEFTSLAMSRQLSAVMSLGIASMDLLRWVRDLSNETHGDACDKSTVRCIQLLDVYAASVGGWKGVPLGTLSDTSNFLRASMAARVKACCNDNLAIPPDLLWEDLARQQQVEDALRERSEAELFPAAPCAN